MELDIWKKKSITNTKLTKKRKKELRNAHSTLKKYLASHTLLILILRANIFKYIHMLQHFIISTSGTGVKKGLNFAQIINKSESKLCTEASVYNYTYSISFFIIPIVSKVWRDYYVTKYHIMSLVVYQGKSQKQQNIHSKTCYNFDENTQQLFSVFFICINTQILPNFTSIRPQLIGNSILILIFPTVIESTKYVI